MTLKDVEKLLVSEKQLELDKYLQVLYQFMSAAVKAIKQQHFLPLCDSDDIGNYLASLNIKKRKIKSVHADKLVALLYGLGDIADNPCCSDAKRHLAASLYTFHNLLSLQLLGNDFNKATHKVIKLKPIQICSEALSNQIDSGLENILANENIVKPPVFAAAVNINPNTIILAPITIDDSERSSGSSLSSFHEISISSDEENESTAKTQAIANKKANSGKNNGASSKEILASLLIPITLGFSATLLKASEEKTKGNQIKMCIWGLATFNLITSAELIDKTTDKLINAIATGHHKLSQAFDSFFAMPSLNKLSRFKLKDKTSHNQSPSLQSSPSYKIH